MRPSGVVFLRLLFHCSFLPGYHFPPLFSFFVQKHVLWGLPNIDLAFGLYGGFPFLLFRFGLGCISSGEKRVRGRGESKKGSVITQGLAL
ncbi:hypothetical protein L873DRAFT_1225202 [Choiromyces venosus 120613-1]|uniref:Uncharacterized protein n=1 Tax=Choiromyces venosus 120613-1 TaxID=1336337 RepID=A0A3N4JGP3_9PEZI|nr:hypothetical protein L873DRAFT_1225202 [Choiromyces venosus 120613-1]